MIEKQTNILNDYNALFNTGRFYLKVLNTQHMEVHGKYETNGKELRYFHIPSK